MSKKFNYVVARPWYDTPESALAIYAFGSEVQQQGTKKASENFLKYVKTQSPDKDWAIYKVKLESIKWQHAQKM